MNTRALTLMLILTATFSSFEVRAVGLYRCEAPGKTVEYVQKSLSGYRCVSIKNAPPPPSRPYIPTSTRMGSPSRGEVPTLSILPGTPLPPYMPSGPVTNETALPPMLPPPLPPPQSLPSH